MTDHYVDKNGNYKGGYGDGAKPEDNDFINLGDNPPPYSAEQKWDFQSVKWLTINYETNGD
ncbi:hypothetical protein [Pseudomonas gingeri]|uniref:hypothetical protein n=1 Tax=Pseudomonas gingeri TaxID=117681 RepID=UPI0015A184DF|nr:hypothetical protein [Pseudomonas gingeri]NWE49243.1 hypothetical protein [Pseudomonas gingeri]